MHIRSVTAVSIFQSLLLLLLLAVVVTSSAASIDVVVQSEQNSKTSSLRRDTTNINGNNNNKKNNNGSRGLIVRRRPRIIGGDPVVDPERFPYFALMDGVSFCGAVLVSKRFVLTAAHCVGADNDFEVGISSKDNAATGGDFVSFLESWLTGRSGSGSSGGGDSDSGDSDGSSKRGSGDVIDYPYKTKIVHPEYSGTTLDADIALYELASDVSDRLLPITLERNAITVAGSPLTAIGFGDTNPSNWIDTVSNVLQEVVVDYVPETECRQSFGSGSSITPGMLCAYEFGEDTCQGDSGGPLFRKGATAADDRLVGLVSWGIDCGGDYPGVYTRISHYYDWIVRSMCALNSAAVPDYVDCTGMDTDTIDDNDTTIATGPTTGGGEDDVFDDFDFDFVDDNFDDDFLGAGLGLDGLLGGDDTTTNFDDDDNDDWWNDDFSDSSESFIDELIGTVAGWFGF